MSHDTREKLIEALDELRFGVDKIVSGADEIATNLANHKITGTQGFSRSCPIANYLKAKGFYYPSVSTIHTTVLNNDGDKDIEILTPTDISVFIGLFDLGHYPKLIAK